MSRQQTTLSLLFCLANSILSAQDTRPALNAEQVKFYIDQVAPILVNNCFACHGPGSSVKGELYLGNRQDILKGGETGPAVDLENPMDSLMIQAMLYQDMEMPPKGKLPQSQVDVIIKWVTNGMPIPPDRETERPVAPKSKYNTEINDETKAYWQHTPVAPSKTPAVKNKKWPPRRPPGGPNEPQELPKRTLNLLGSPGAHFGPPEALLGLSWRSREPLGRRPPG